MQFRSMVAAACAAGLSGCATFIDGSQQYITINSAPGYYAHCVLSRPGESFNVTTPGSIRIAKTDDDLTVRCHRPGYADTVGTIPSDVNLWTVGNLLTGGVTVAVDAWTGAMYEYPNSYDVPMSPGMTPSAAAADSSTYSLPPPPAAAPPVAPDPQPETAASPPPDSKRLPGTLPDNF
ncbi:MAG TPA: hypothetical protein VL285_11990 [Bryobacteraceae bacterium]|nr:hypothetical protein [Bryobacteraceae bacterium]